MDPASVGAELVWTDRGGDVTYHGPGQLVGYPVLTLPPKRGTGSGMADTVAYVRTVEDVVIGALADLGLSGAGRLSQYPGVWVETDGRAPRKIAAIGVRLSRGRTMHGFALNVSTDLSMFGHIVPCGIVGKAVTSLAAEGTTSRRSRWSRWSRRASAAAGAQGEMERQDVVWRHRPADLVAFSRRAARARWCATASSAPRRSAGRGGRDRGAADRGTEAGVAAARVHHGARGPCLKPAVRELGLVTVCEEAGCPNLSECWADGTATFMVLGERCTRACGFCLVDTRQPGPARRPEPERVADAVERLGPRHAVVTMVARDDLDDGDAASWPATSKPSGAGARG